MLKQTNRIRVGSGKEYWHDAPGNNSRSGARRGRRIRSRCVRRIMLGQGNALNWVRNQVQTGPYPSPKITIETDSTQPSNRLNRPPKAAGKRKDPLDGDSAQQRLKP